MARIGVMGCGVVADYGHIPAILQTPGLQLVSLFDPNEARLQEESSKFGISQAYTNVEQFFDSGLDAVLISSPAPTHYQNVLMAAERGIDVLCEKPLAMEDHQAHEMIEAMEKAKKQLLVGYVYRFSPVAQQIKRWVQEKVVGEIRSLRLIYVWDLHGQYDQLPDGKWVESPRYIGRMEEGGPMVDCGVHQIDLARWWLGKEVVGYDSSAAWVAEYDAPDHVYLHMNHQGGALSTIEMSFSYGHTARQVGPIFTYDLIGTGGYLRYDRDGYILEAHTGQDTIRVPGASEKNFPAMHAAWAHALETGEPGDFPTGIDGLLATKIARESTEELIRRHKATLAVK